MDPNWRNLASGRCDTTLKTVHMHQYISIHRAFNFGTLEILICLPNLVRAVSVLNTDHGYYDSIVPTQVVRFDAAGIQGRPGVTQTQMWSFRIPYSAPALSPTVRVTTDLFGRGVFVILTVYRHDMASA